MNFISAKEQLKAIEAASFSNLKDETRAAIIKELNKKTSTANLDMGDEKSAPKGKGQPIELSSFAKILGGK